MTTAIDYDALRHTLEHQGGAAAVERLCCDLRQRGEYDRLLDALLLQIRQRLGLPLLPAGEGDTLSPAFEEAAREAVRTVGRLYLDAGDIINAWRYFGWLSEPAPIAEALEKVEPGQDEEGNRLIEIAFHHRVSPRRGFEWLLQRYGLCSAITTLSNQDFSQQPEILEHCTRLLVRALHNELLDRLKADIARHEQATAVGGSVPELLAGRDWLLADGFPHVDVSHLQAVVHFALHLSPCPELTLAQELCQYGQRLSEGFQPSGEPPFEQGYRDYEIYLAVLAGDNVEAGLAHFRAKAERAERETDGGRPVEVLVNLLLRLNRSAEALAVARTWLRKSGDWPAHCPGPTELCRRAGDFAALAEVAQERGDPVQYLAGLLAARQSSA